MRSSARPEKTARGVAFRVLARVAEDAAFASASLDAELARSRLDERDARLASAIVYGTLRELADVDRIIASKLHRGGKLDSAARAALRASVFQLGALDRQPAHAVVDEAVRWVRDERGEKVSGFVNAVLRKIVADGEKMAPRGIELPAAVEAMLLRSLGTERLARTRAAFAAPPPIDLRVIDGGDRAVLVETLRRARPRAEVGPARYSPLGVRTRRVGDPRSLPGYLEGRFVVQEQGSQLVGLLLGARPGDAVLDACAGRGGKTTLLAERVGPGGRVVATDVHEARLEQIAGTFTRLGLTTPLETRAVDFTVGTGGLGAEFDRVLVDAPCSGLGTLHRRPEIALRVTAESIAELATTQRLVLERAARCLKPGGVLVFAVCSVLDEESRDVVAGATLPELRPLPFEVGETFGIPPDADGSLRLGPFLDDVDGGTDGYRVMRFVRI